MMCDLTIAAENAIFGQTGPKVGSFDGGWGASYMARIVGQKKRAKSGSCAVSTMQQALDMGWSTPSSRWQIWKRDRALVSRNAAKQPDGALPEGGAECRL